MKRIPSGYQGCDDKGMAVDYDISHQEARMVATVRSFGEQYFSWENVRRWSHDGGLPDEVVHDFVNLDFEGFGIIHRRDHVKYDLVAQCLVLEELARVSGATLPFSNDFFNLQIMEEFAGYGEFEFVRRQYQDTGRLAFAVAFSEPEGGSDALSMRTHVKGIDGHLVLSGRKTYVNNGEFAPYLLVGAVDKDAPGGKYPELSFWLVPNGLPGIEAYPIQKIGQNFLPFSDIIFKDVVLNESHRLHGKHVGFPQMFHLLETGRLFVCVTALGLAQAAMEDAIAFASKRSAFGSSIMRFQMVEDMLVDMEIKLRTMRDMVYRAAVLLDSGEERAEEARLQIALAKRYVPETATAVASSALQIFGGRGYTVYERVGRIWEDCRGFQIAEGTDQIMVYIAGPLLDKAYARKAQA